MEVVVNSSAASPATLPSRPGSLLRWPAVNLRTGLGKSSVYVGIKNGSFPAPVKLSARLVAWREEDIDLWITQRTASGIRQ